MADNPSMTTPLPNGMLLQNPIHAPAAIVSAAAQFANLTVRDLRNVNGGSLPTQTLLRAQRDHQTQYLEDFNTLLRNAGQNGVPEGREAVADFFVREAQSNDAQMQGRMATNYSASSAQGVPRVGALVYDRGILPNSIVSIATNIPNESITLTNDSMRLTDNSPLQVARTDGRRAVMDGNFGPDAVSQLPAATQVPISPDGATLDTAPGTTVDMTAVTNGIRINGTDNATYVLGERSNVEISIEDRASSISGQDRAIFVVPLSVAQRMQANQEFGSVVLLANGNGANINIGMFPAISALRGVPEDQPPTPLSGTLRIQDRFGRTRDIPLLNNGVDATYGDNRTLQQEVTRVSTEMAEMPAPEPEVQLRRR